MNTYAVYLWPRGSLASMPGSDTIFGAVCWGIQVLGLEDVGEMLSHFTPPRFAFSSPCPVYRSGQKRLHFYPRPAWLTLSPDDIEQLTDRESQRSIAVDRKRARAEVVQQAKQFKRLTYLSEKLFQSVVQGERGVQDIYHHLRRPYHAGNSSADIEQSGEAAIGYDERYSIQPQGPFDPWLLRERATPHNHIDRVAGATAGSLLFYEDEIFFRPGAGLWCLLRTEETTLNTRIMPALRYLQDTGFGANRTAGKGQFTIEVEPAPDLPDAGDEANGLIVLSRYLPEPDEIQFTERPLAYELITLSAKRERKFPRSQPGQATPPVYKRRLRMFKPGSVFPYQQQLTAPIYGRLAEVTADGDDQRHTWQSGLAIGLRAKVEVNHG